MSQGQKQEIMLATVPVVNQILQRMKPEFEKAIPALSGLTAERLFKVALTEIRRNPKLTECDPISFGAAVMEAAQLGLEFGETHQCALVPYGREVKLMVQYQGYLALLWRSKAIKTVAVRTVFDCDEFEVSYGEQTFIVHKPKFPRTKGAVPIAYYAAIHTLDGGFMCDVMTEEECVDHAKQYSRGIAAKDSPWNTAFDEMAKKTVLRRLVKLMSFAPETRLPMASKIDEDLYQAEKKVQRVETLQILSAAQDAQTPEQLEVAKQRLAQAMGNAEAFNVDIGDLIAALKKEDYSNAKKVNALADLITDHLESVQNGREKPAVK